MEISFFKRIITKCVRIANIFIKKQYFIKKKLKNRRKPTNIFAFFYLQMFFFDV